MLGIASRNEDKYSGCTINTAPDNREASTNQKHSTAPDNVKHQGGDHTRPHRLQTAAATDAGLRRGQQNTRQMVEVRRECMKLGRSELRLQRHHRSKCSRCERNCHRREYCPFFLQIAEPLYVQRNIPQCRCASGGQHNNSVETVQC